MMFTGHIDSEAVERLWGKRATKKRRSIKEKTELSLSDADYRKRKSFMAEEWCSKMVFDNKDGPCCIVNELAPEILLEPNGIATNIEKSADDKKSANEETMQISALEPIVIDDIITVSPQSQKVKDKELGSRCKTLDQKCPCAEEDLVTMIVNDRIEGFDWSVVKPLRSRNGEQEVFDDNEIHDYIVNQLILEEVLDPEGVVVAVSCGKSVQEDETETVVDLHPLQPIQTDNVIAVSPEPQKINGNKLECDSHGNELEHKSHNLEDDLTTMVVEDRKEGFDWSVTKSLCNGNDMTEMEFGMCDRAEAARVIESETTQAIKSNDEQKRFESEERLDTVNKEDFKNEEGSRLVNETELDSDETFTVEKEIELENIESSVPKTDAVAEKHEDTDDKTKTDMNSNTVLLKPVTDTHTLKRKKFSEADGEPNSKRINLSNDKELDRLKKEYDTILADFWKHRSSSFGEEPGIVPTKNISVIPAEPSEISHPPPPDVITHSETTTTTTANASESYSSDGFPSPPPDLVTQTIITPHPTNATYIETKEVTSTRMLPPEVQTHTVVIGGDNMSNEEIERLMKEGMVSTSETTITKTSVMTTQQRVEKTIVTEQSTVVAEDGNVVEETH